MELKGKILIVPAYGSLYWPIGIKQIIEESWCAILLKVFFIARFLISFRFLQAGAYVSISEIQTSSSCESLSRIIKGKGFRVTLCSSQVIALELKGKRLISLKAFTGRSDTDSDTSF